jgi:hypothetical protein
MEGQYMSGRRQRPEAAIQRAVFQHLRTRGAPGVFAFHPANGGWRSPIEGAIFRGLSRTGIMSRLLERVRR